MARIVGDGARAGSTLGLVDRAGGGALPVVGATRSGLGLLAGVHQLDQVLVVAGQRRSRQPGPRPRRGCAAQHRTAGHEARRVGAPIGRQVAGPAPSTAAPDRRACRPAAAAPSPASDRPSRPARRPAPARGQTARHRPCGSGRGRPRRRNRPSARAASAAARRRVPRWLASAGTDDGRPAKRAAGRAALARARRRATRRQAAPGAGAGCRCEQSRPGARRRHPGASMRSGPWAGGCSGR